MLTTKGPVVLDIMEGKAYSEPPYRVKPRIDEEMVTCTGVAPNWPSTTRQIPVLVPTYTLSPSAALGAAMARAEDELSV